MPELPRRRVALLVETSHGSGREILKGIARFSRQNANWQLFHGASGLTEQIPEWLDEWEGDAVIARIQNEETREKLEKIDIPVVDVLGVCPNPFPLVHVDDIAIAQMAARHFLDRDFQHFAYCGIAGENWSELRGKAFQEATRERLSFHEFQSPRTRDSPTPHEFQRLQEWLRKLPKPTAMMVCSDQRGLELLEACLSEKIPVPEEIAVVSVDNDLALCDLSDPPLSSIRGGHFNVGFEAARLTEHLLNGGEAPRKPLLVPPNGLVERESSRVRAIDDPVVARGVQFIRENLADSLTNDSIARAVGVSRTLFQQKFRESMKKTIREFILERRIERAVLLIESTDIPFAEIADRSGFRHQEYLGQVVKKATGCTPGTLRKEALHRTPEKASIPEE